MSPVQKHGDLTYYDISPEISEHIAVWPGDQKFRRTQSVDFQSGGNLVLSSVLTTVHVGAHTDAPSHYHPDGKTIASRALHYYLGPCQVITVSVPRGQRIRPADIAHVKIRAQRVLLKSGSFPDPYNWNTDFNALSPELVEYLYGHGAILIGIDTPSVDLFDDKILESHRAIFKRDMAILEGIILSDVPDGEYGLVALPLRIKDGDASPVRAILTVSSNSRGYYD